MFNTTTSSIQSDSQVELLNMTPNKAMESTKAEDAVSEFSIPLSEAPSLYRGEQQSPSAQYGFDCNNVENAQAEYAVSEFSIPLSEAPTLQCEEQRSPSARYGFDCNKVMENAQAEDAVGESDLPLSETQTLYGGGQRSPSAQNSSSPSHARHRGHCRPKTWIIWLVVIAAAIALAIGLTVGLTWRSVFSWRIPFPYELLLNTITGKIITANFIRSLILIQTISIIILMFMVLVLVATSYNTMMLLSVIISSILHLHGLIRVPVHFAGLNYRLKEVWVLWI